MKTRRPLLAYYGIAGSTEWLITYAVEHGIWRIDTTENWSTKYHMILRKVTELLVKKCKWRGMYIYSPASSRYDIVVAIASNLEVDVRGPETRERAEKVLDIVRQEMETTRPAMWYPTQVKVHARETARIQPTEIRAWCRERLGRNSRKRKAVKADSEWETVSEDGGEGGDDGKDI